jgi:hypothetical protein
VAEIYIGIPPPVSVGDLGAGGMGLPAGAATFTNQVSLMFVTRLGG